MGDWYTIGLALGLGTALGVLFAGLLSATPLGRIAAVAARRCGRGGGRARDRRLDRGRRRRGRGARRRGCRRDRRLRSAPAWWDARRARADRRRGRRWAWPGSRSSPARAISSRSHCRSWPCASAAPRPTGTPACAALPATKKLILIVIDGLTPSMLEDTLERGVAPSLGLLAEHGRYRRAISTFPSLTPVCLSSLATGAHPDVHEIPHLVWYHRGERRLVEYGSSFGAVRAAGTKQSLVDTIYGLNASHLGSGAVTVYEALEDAGLTAAAINITCYRGRHPHRADRPLPHPSGVRPEPLLLLQPLRVGRDRRAARRAQPPARDDRRLRGGGRPLARDARRLRLPRLLPLRLRLRLAHRRGRMRRTRRSPAATTPSGR